MPDGEPVTLGCMEVWGGSRAIDTSASVPGLDVYVSSVPHAGDDAGGDVHYVSLCGAGAIARFVLADVSGHGEGVRRVAEVLRGLVRKNINTVDQSAFTEAIGDEFSRLAEGGTFATAVLASYFATTQHLVLTNAGHPRPMYRSAATGAWSALHEATAGVELARSARDVGIDNLPLGIIEPTAYHQYAVKLAVGDVVVFYTDALMESVGDDGEQLGEAGVLELARSLPADGVGIDPAAIGRGLLGAVRAMRGGGDAGDDETVVVLGHNGAPAPPQSVADRLRTVCRLVTGPAER